MRFDQITGQQGAKSLLRGMADSGRIPHAQIFLGKEGTGKLAAALAFAQYVMCRHKEGGEACGRCSDCIKAGRLVHPDIHFSYPTVGSKVLSATFAKEWREALAGNPYMNTQQWLRHINAENKQGNINKDECHAIVKKLSLKVFEGAYKIMIIWRPEFLGKEGNRLLKLIEEPPEQTLFILVAEEAEQILNTILSRCQIVKFNPLSDGEITTLLQTRGVEEGRATQIARLADGNVNAALSLMEEETNDNAALFLEWMRIGYLGKPKDIVEWGDRFARLGRENQKHFFDYGLFFMREYMVLKITGDDRVRLGGRELATAKNLTKVIEYEQIPPLTGILTDSAFHISRNANPKILMTDITVRMHHILRKFST